MIPNRGFPDPWGSKTRFLGDRNAIFEGESLYVFGFAFFKRTEIYESLQVLLLKRTLFKLTLLLYQFIACIAISASCCGYHAEDGRWCDCKHIPTFKCLWRNYGELGLRYYRTRSFLVFNHAKVPEIEYKSPVYYNGLCNNTFRRIWILLSTSVEKQVSEPFETSNDFGMALCNCVPRHERIISEEHQQKCHYVCV